MNRLDDLFGDLSVGAELRATMRTSVRELEPTPV